MPLTITKRVTIGVTTMVFFSGLLSLLLYVDLQKIIGTLEHILHIEEPINTSAYELEINALEIGMRVVKYSSSQKTNERALLAQDMADFEKFHAQYTALARDPQARDLGIKVQTLYTEFKNMGLIIMNGRDAVSQSMQTFKSDLQAIERLINTGLIKSVSPRASKGLEKLLSAQMAAPKTTEKLRILQAMDTYLTGLGDALGDHLKTNNPVYRQRIMRNATQFKLALTQFTQLPNNTAQASITKQISQKFNNLHLQAEKSVAQKERLLAQEEHFNNLQQKINDELAEGIKALTTSQLNVARFSIDQVTQDILAVLLILAPLLLAGSVSAGVMIVRWIKRPIEELTEGALRIGSGDWEYRIPQHGQDEFADLAMQFNTMVERLQTTTVSKLALEASEKELQSTNVQLVKEIEKHKLAQATIQQMAYYDALTDLPNRRLFNDRLQQAILTAGREHKSIAIMLMDLDHFKEVNDTLGHHYGDLLLQQVGKRVRVLLRESDTIARLGGDEFAVLLNNTDRQGAILTAENINHALNQPFELGEISYNASMSIGIALFLEHGNDASSLLRRADIAMYVAKGASSGHVVYETAHDKHSTERLLLVGELRRAIENKQELVLHYQPIIDCATKHITSVEALIRWQHPKRGLLQPDAFIDRAEDAGLMLPLTLWVLGEALSQGNRWTAKGLQIPIAVNISAPSMHLQPLWLKVSDLLSEHTVTPGQLAFEITESAIMEDPIYASSLMTYLNECGISVSIDDFGTGYSSLAYLSRLPVHNLKIDKSFVLGMIKNKNDEMIVRSTIALSHNMQIKVIAEGVEDQQTLDRLISHGCDSAQGYFIGRPLPADAFDQWLLTSPWFEHPLLNQTLQTNNAPSKQSV